MHLNRNATDEEILQFVESWIDDLVRDDYESAFDRTSHDPYYQWTPELMRAVIHGYGSPEPHRSEKVFVVTPRESAYGGPPQRSVARGSGPPNALAEVWYDLPLNGKWSDLTATFRLEAQGDGMVVVLQEIHGF